MSKLNRAQAHRGNIMKNLNAKKVLAMAVLASIATTSVAEIAIEEVVVTARKRAENLQEVPIAVTAFTEAQIESAGIQRPGDFISLNAKRHHGGFCKRWRYPSEYPRYCFDSRR